MLTILIGLVYHMLDICYPRSSLWRGTTCALLEQISSSSSYEDGLDDPAFQHHECVLWQDLGGPASAACHEQEQDPGVNSLVHHGHFIDRQPRLCHRHRCPMHARLCSLRWGVLEP